MDHLDHEYRWCVMTERHRHPDFLRNRRIVRAQVQQAWRLGTEVTCWRCRRVLEPGASFDVGHLGDPDDHTRANLAAECVTCNRRDGGRRGAAITNGRRARPAAPRRTSTGGLAPW